MRKLLLLIIVLFFTGVTQAQTETYSIDWSFNSTPTAEGAANSSITIEEGDTVTWVWYASGNHNVKSEPDAAESFESPFQGNGATFSHTFTVVGTNDYICEPHSGNMFGTITVVPDGTLSNGDFLMNNDDLVLFPNPVENTLNVSFNVNIAGEVKITLYNALGQQIKTYDDNLNSNLELDMVDLTTGIYFLKIENSSSSVTKRFIKK